MAQATLNRILEEVETLEPEDVAFLARVLRSREDNKAEWRELTAEAVEEANARLRALIVYTDFPVNAANEEIVRI